MEPKMFLKSMYRMYIPCWVNLASSKFVVIIWNWQVVLRDFFYSFLVVLKYMVCFSMLLEQGGDGAK